MLCTSCQTHGNIGCSSSLLSNRDMVCPTDQSIDCSGTVGTWGLAEVGLGNGARIESLVVKSLFINPYCWRMYVPTYLTDAPQSPSNREPLDPTVNRDISKYHTPNQYKVRLSEVETRQRFRRRNNQKTQILIDPISTTQQHHSCQNLQ